MKNQTTNQTAEKATTKLKNSTQQKQVELIEKQKWELISATATIDNQAATIKDLTDRNDNLRSQVLTANERIEILQHENKNYESAIKVIEDQNNKVIADNNTSLTEAFDRNNTLCDHLEATKESRERLASKFTNWFIFLVTVLVGSIALNVYQYFNN